MQRVLAVPVAVVIAIAVAVAVQSETAEEAPRRPVAYATIYAYGEFLDGVAGDIIETKRLVPDGIEVHDWGPDARDVADTQDAIAIVYGGAIDAAHIERLSIESTATFIDLAPDDGSHTWLDPSSAIEQVSIIRDALSGIDTQNADAYAQNAATYTARLTELESEFDARLAECEHRTMITFYAALEQMVKGHGITAVHASESHHAEASASEIIELIEHARNADADVIFADETTGSRYENVVAEELGIDVIELRSLETAGDGTTYFEQMERNIDALERGLSCKKP